MRVSALPVLLVLLPVSTLSLTCFDCFDTGPDHSECTTARNCTGKACMIFDAGDGKKLTAFCILALKNDDSKKSGCWMEEDGVGQHCICHDNFCNRLDRHIRSGASGDPLAPNVVGAEMLKANPLVDYDDEGAAPAPVNVLFPAAEAADPKTAGNDDDGTQATARSHFADLVPINFDEYEDHEKQKEGANLELHSLKTNEIGESQDASPPSSAVPRPPRCVLLLLTMAASWARLFAGI